MSNKEIENLCEDICNNLQDGPSIDGSKSLRLLRKLCGLRGCGCSKLTPSQNLSRLLKLHHSESALSLSVGLAIINNCDTLEQEEHCNRILERLVTLTIKMEPSEEGNHFLLQLWSYSGLRHFTISTIEDLISHHSHFLEEDILEIFTEWLQHNAEWPFQKDSKCERIVWWSCNSSRIFCVVTSIFNEILQKSVRLFGQYKRGINVVSQFICNVKLRCIENKKDFILLYPFEYHCLISVLDINPNCYPEHTTATSSVTISTVIRLIKQNIRRKSVQTLCILTHFPAWLPYVDR